MCLITLKFVVGVKTVAIVSFAAVIVLITRDAIKVIVAARSIITYVAVLSTSSDFIMTPISSISDI